MLALYTNLSVRLRRDEKGATAVEYGIMVALIAVVIIAAVTLLGSTLGDMFGDVKCQITDSANPKWTSACQHLRSDAPLAQAVQISSAAARAYPPPPDWLTVSIERPPCRGHPNAALSLLSSRF